MLTLSVVIGAVGILVISTSLVYLLSALAVGSGSLTNLVTNIGWSSLPLLFVNFLSTAVLWTLASLGQLLPLTGQQPTLPVWVTVFNSSTGILAYVWIGYLLTYGIATARNLAVRQSAVVAGLIVVLPILNALLSFL